MPKYKTFYGRNFFPVLLFLSLFIYANQLYSQNCKLEIVPGYTGKGCAPYTIKLKALNTDKSKTAVRWKWDFGDGITNNNPLTDSIVSHTYTQAPQDTTINYKPCVNITFSDGSQCQVCLSTKIRVWELPKPDFTLPSQTSQCLSGNSFCFNDATKLASSGAPIVKYYWDFGDGEIDSVSKNPCHTYKSFGYFNISLTVKDANGCIENKIKTAVVTVLPQAQLSFENTDVSGCIGKEITFTNKSNLTGFSIQRMFWDFGDGSPVDDDPAHRQKVTHKYTKPGSFLPKLVLITTDGCTSEVVAAKPANIFENSFNVKVNDYPCWNEANSNGISFNMQDGILKGFSSIAWNFGDPESGAQNIVVNSFQPIHRFLGGPGVYQVKVTAVHPFCGQIDTCIVLHINGPMARINIPAAKVPIGWDKYKPQTRLYKNNFNSMLQSGACGGEINYVFYRNHTLKQRADSNYCNAQQVSGSLIADTFCSASKPDLLYYWKGIKFKASGFKTVTYIDSQMVTLKWKSGDPLPHDTLRLFTPPAGVKFEQNMSNAELNSCTFPNLVRFTNNSIKFRASNNTGRDKFGAKDFAGTKYHFKAYDDKWPNPNPDTCRNRNWPYASDSLLYFWNFNDPGSAAKPCTSTVNGIKWPSMPQPGVKPEDCNYSTLATPYHFYRSLSLQDPERPCYLAQLTVVDPVTGCQNIEAIPISMGKPSASWDRNAYCGMNWYIQQYYKAKKPRKGFMLSGQPRPCAGENSKYNIDLSELLPGICKAPEDYWITFDSARYRSQNTIICQFKDAKNQTHNIYEYGFTANDNWRGGNAAQWRNTKWQNRFWYDDTTSGCKTIGVVVKNGSCYDTAWYSNYICLNKLVPQVVLLDSANNTQLAKETIRSGNNISKKENTGIITANSSGISPASKVKVAVKEINQFGVTGFHYQLRRIIAPAGKDLYYDKSFWPDSLTLQDNPEQALQIDSITSVKAQAFIPKDEISNGGLNLYILKYNPFTFTYDKIPLGSAEHEFYIFKNELDALNLNKQVQISNSDPRTKRFNFECGSSGINPIKIYANTVPVAISRSLYFLDLNHTKKDNSTTGLHGKLEKDTVVFKLPYPGVYNLDVNAVNIEGCAANAKEPYKIINGHYAKFSAIDSVICTGATVKFRDKVRYFSTDCPANIITGIPTTQDICFYGIKNPGNTAVNELTPWDSAGPIMARKNLNSSWPTPMQLERPIAWDFDNDGVIDSYGHNPVWQYKNPGVYSVAMYTTDSNGYQIRTIRRNFIKAISVKANFNLKNPSDKEMTCAPKVIEFADSSDISQGVNTFFVNRRVFAYKEKVISKCFNGAKWVNCIKDTVFKADSIVAWRWNLGDGRQPITRTQFNATIPFVYNSNDTFSLSQQVITTRGCYDSIYKKNLFSVKGPKPRFKIESSIKGCTPLTVKVRNLSLVPGGKYIWNKGDGTNITTSSTDTFVNLVYHNLKPADVVTGKDSSRFLLNMTQIDSVFDAKSGTKVLCSAIWPDTIINPKDAKWITVQKGDSLFITGDTTNCPGKELGFKLNSKSGNLNQFTSWDWNFGDGKVLNNQTSENVLHTFDLPGVYYVKATAQAIKGCAVESYSFSVQISGLKVHFSPSKVKTNTFSFSNDTKDTSGHNITKYYWNFGDTTALDSVSWTSVQHTYKGGGPYNVSLKVIYGNGCTSIFDTTVSSSTGINETALNNFKINISPNPFTGSTNIQYSLTEKANVKIQVYDVTGKLITSLADTKAQPGDYNLHLDAQKLNMRAGIFFVKIMISDKIADRKIIRLQ